MFTKKKIADEIKVTEPRPPLIKQQYVVYEYKCDLCDAGYVGYRCRHLFQRINEHKHSIIGKPAGCPLSDNRVYDQGT